MDQIDFEIITHDNGFFDVAVSINKKKISTAVFNTLSTLAAGLVDEVEFDLFTCTCGVSGCAGFHDPIKQKKTQNNVLWLFSDDYKLPQKYYSFNRKDFDSKLLKLNHEIFDLFRKGLFDMTCYEIISRGEQINENIEVLFMKQVSFFNFQKKFNDFCKEQMPFVNNISISYDGYEAKNISVNNLVNMLLNRWTEPTSSIFYWGRVLKACEAVNLWTLNGDSQALIYLDNRSYEDFGDYSGEKLNFIERLTFEKEVNGKTECLYFNEGSLMVNGVKKDIPSDFSVKDLKVNVF